MTMTLAQTGDPHREILTTLVERLGSPGYLHHLIEYMPIGILMVGRDYKVNYCNVSAGKILGIGYDDLFGHALDDLLADDKTNLSHCYAEFVDSAGEEAHYGRTRYELHLQNPSGEKRVVDAIIDDTGRSDSEYLLVYLMDITVRRKLETDQQQRSTFFFNLIDSSVDGIIAADMKGNLIIFNQGAQQLLGYTEEEAFYSLHVTRLYPEGEAQSILKNMRSDEYGGRGKLLRHELIAITKDGRHIPMSLSGGIIYEGDKEVATFGIFTDLRAIQKIEKDLKQTHQMLLQSEKMAGLGRLAAGVAHELNNPMSGIMMYSNLILEQTDADSPIVDDLKVIVHEAERCKQIVADLLEFSHQTTYEASGIDLNEQITKAVSILTKQPLFHNIVIDYQLEETLSRIWGNPIRLVQVFTNIVINAAQAMSGKGRLTIVTRHRSNNDIVEACITDNGPGIDDETLAQVFDPFFTTKTPGEGTGLGLSVSYAIIREHKGTIRVDSEIGEGTTFSLRFPVLRDELSDNKVGPDNEPTDLIS